MNYAASPYNPNYAPAYDAAYAQAQQQAAALDQLQQMYGGDPYGQQYPMVAVGQALPGGVVVAATPPNLTPLQGAWWQQPTFGVPRWALGAGALALTGIGLAWQAGVFGGKSRSAPSSSRSRTTVRRSTARDASRGARTTSLSRSGPKGRTTTLTTTAPAGERDMNSPRRKSSKRRRKSGGAKRRR